jgi:hypothetical protein
VVGSEPSLVVEVSPETVAAI